MARRLTVLQVLPALEAGGVERGTLELAAGLVKAESSIAGDVRRWATSEPIGRAG